MRIWRPILLAAMAIAGCARGVPVSEQAEPALRAQAAENPVPLAAILDPARLPAMIDVNCIEITAPSHSLSQNEPFWNLAADIGVDSATHDLLYKNGIQVAEGKDAEWPKFKKILDAAGANSLQSHFIGISAKDQDFPAGGAFAEQTLFYFDQQDRLCGRVYDECQNLFGLSYRASPAQPHCVRIELCPLVRAARKHYRYTVLNDEESVSYVGDEQLFDLGLRVDLPPEKFLIVAPSPQSDRAMSIGHQFLTQDGKSGRSETVLIFAINNASTWRVATTAPTLPDGSPSAQTR